MKRDGSFLISFLIVILASCGSNTSETNGVIKNGTGFTSWSLRSTLAAQKYTRGDPVYIRIFKQEDILELWFQPAPNSPYELHSTVGICAWSGRLGPKLKEGDRQSPEGFYSVGKAALNPNSTYHLSFNLGFPNAYDTYHGRTGSFLMVHGGCASIGCYAITDEGIDLVYDAVESALGQGDDSNNSVPVHIFPFRMTEENFARYPSHPWLDFWVMLETAFTQFERTKFPPSIKHSDGVYRID